MIGQFLLPNKIGMPVGADEAEFNGQAGAYGQFPAIGSGDPWPDMIAEILVAAIRAGPIKSRDRFRCFAKPWVISRDSLVKRADFAFVNSDSRRRYSCCTVQTWFVRARSWGCVNLDFRFCLGGQAGGYYRQPRIVKIFSCGDEMLL